MSCGRPQRGERVGAETIDQSPGDGEAGIANALHGTAGDAAWAGGIHAPPHGRFRTAISPFTLEAAPKRFVSGETLPYLGRNARMIVDTGDVRSPEVRFDHWRFRVAVPEGLEGEERQQRIRRAIVGWYRDRAAERLPNVVERWWPRLGQGERSRVLVRDQRQRWGSCAPDGTLRFNWRATMLSPALIEYVVVHELAHLTHRNHSTDFRGLVSEAMPDAQQRRQRLREAGRTLPL